MHNYAKLFKTMYANDHIVLSSLRINIIKVNVKFHLNPISSFSEKSGMEGRKKYINYG